MRGADGKCKGIRFDKVGGQEAAMALGKKWLAAELKKVGVAI